MNRLNFITLFIFLLTGCSDSSPIRSDVEVKYNQLFNTKFGVITNVNIMLEKDIVDVINPREFLEYLEDLEKTNTIDIQKDLTIQLSTSNEMKQYSKEQTSSNLYYDTEKKLLCGEEICYLATQKLDEKMKYYR